MEIHHKKPLIDGGQNDETNLTVLCDICHAEDHITEPDFKKWIGTPPGTLIELAMERGDDVACYLIKNWKEIKEAITLSTMISQREQETRERRKKLKATKKRRVEQ